MKLSSTFFAGFAAVAMGVISATAPAASLGKWNAVRSGTGTDFEAVAFGNGTFVAVGDKGLIMTSPDGVKWTKRSAGVSRTFNDVTFSSGRFIAVCRAPDGGGVGAKIFVSDSNGASWKFRDTDAGGDSISVGLHAVAGDGSGNLVAVGGVGWVTRSHDNGQTWDVLTTRFTTQSLYGVAWGKGVWVATGDGGVFRSTDANVWTPATETFPGYKVGFGNNRFVATAAAGGGGFKSSSDGNKWTQCVKAAGFTSDGWPIFSNGVAFGDGTFVVSGGNGDLWTSETGLVWKKWSSPLTGTQLQGAAFGQRMFISAGYDGRMVSSPPWMKARLGSTWDYPFTLFDTEDGAPKRIGLPEYRVNTASLNLVLEATLFYMPTLSAPVNVRLVYGSAPTEDGADTIGLFGKNWRFRYESVIGQFGPEAQVITGGGRSMAWGTPKGEDLATATLGTPIALVPPAGIFDELKFYGPGNYFELKLKASKQTLRYGVAGGPGNAIWRLTRITDRSGNQVNLNVTAANGRINSIADATRTVSFTYNADNLCTRITAPDGRHVDFTYDTHKNLTTITDMVGYTGRYEYDKLGYLTRMTTAGRVNSFTYGVRPGYEVEDGEATEKMIASATNSNGDVTRYKLLPKDAGVERTDPRGAVTVFTSDRGQTAKVTDPLGEVRQLVFNQAKLPEAFTDSNGDSTEFEYDARGNLTKLTDALGHATNYTYDANDNRLTRTDALSHTTTYTYDPSSRLLTTTTPLSFVTTLTYYGNGRVNTVKDARNNTTSFLYNAAGDLTRVTDPLARATNLSYDTTGRCTGITDQRGKTKAFTYDNNDRLLTTQFTSGTGSPTRTNTYNAFGQTRATNESGQAYRIDRNDFGFVTMMTDPLGNIATTEYDPSNNPTAITDALGRGTKTTYDAKNRPLVSTDATGKAVARAYDDDGNLTSFTDKRKGVTTFDYDAANRLVKTTDPLGRTVTNTRDAVGRITATTNARGQQIKFTYDNDGRVTKREYVESEGAPPVTEAVFTYDANGNVTSQTDDWGTTTRIFDANNRVTSITYPGGKIATFTYNESGLPATITYPGGLVVTYTYDNFNRLPSPTIGRSGSLVGAAERAVQITSLQMALGGNIRTIAYTYNASALPTLTDRPGTVPDTTYTYDGMNRLASMSHGGLLTWSYTYDAVSNMIEKNASGTALLAEPLPEPAHLAYNKANQVTTRNGTTFTYDADGNLTAQSGGAFTASYTPENRPTQITRAGETIAYTYDAAGMRVVRSVQGGETVQFHYGPAGNLLFTTNGAGIVQDIYVWKGGALAAILAGPSVINDLRYPLMDNLGAVMAVVKPDGTSEVGYSYHPYGGAHREAQAGALDPGLFTFVGGLGVQDEGAGLFYMRHRFYDSTTGRFLQRDPSGFSGGANLYAYTSANPIGLIDPSGLGGQPWEDDPGMNEAAVREAQEKYDYWEANGGWANRPQPAPSTGTEAFGQKAAFYVADKALGLTPVAGPVYGTLKASYYIFVKGEYAKGAWEGYKTALGPVGDVVDLAEDVFNEYGPPPQTEKEIRSAAFSEATKRAELGDPTAMDDYFNTYEK